MTYFILADFNTDSNYNGTSIPKNLKGIKIIGPNEASRPSRRLGVADTNNNLLTPCKYNHIGIVEDLLVCTYKGAPVDIYRISDQKVLQTESFQDFSFPRRGLMSCKRGGLYGCINSKLEIVIPFVAEGSILFDNIDYIVKRINGKLALISGLGGISFINCDYLYAVVIKENCIACQEINSKWGFINFNMDIIVPFAYDALLLGINQNLMAVRKGYKFGFVDIENCTEIIPCIYDEVEPFGEKMPFTSVKMGDRNFFINNVGERVNCLDF